MKSSESSEDTKHQSLINFWKYVKTIFSNSEDASSNRWYAFIILISIIIMAFTKVDVAYVKILAWLFVGLVISKESIKFMK